MADPNMTDFYDRIRRYEKMRSKGFGHEAAGALGRSFYSQAPARRRRSVLLPVILTLFCAIVLKAALYHTVGPASYQERVARLEAGQGVDRFGAWLMQADPLTVFVAGQISHAVALVKG
jgi:hypothetical protein